MKADDDAIFVAGVPQHARLLLLCRVGGTTFAEIERCQGLARGSVSAYVGGRSYLYPRLRAAIVEHLSNRLGVDGQVVAAYLFEGRRERSSQPGGPQDGGLKRARGAGCDRRERQAGCGAG
jgi:hypothetical protein